MQLGLMTLATLKQRTGAFKHIVAGHGEIYSTSERANQAIDYMVQCLESIFDTVRTALAEGTPRSPADLLSAVAQAQGAVISALSQHVLYQTTIQSVVSTVSTRGEIYPLFQDNHLLWCMGSTK